MFAEGSSRLFKSMEFGCRLHGTSEDVARERGLFQDNGHQHEKTYRAAF